MQRVLRAVYGPEALNDAGQVADAIPTEWLHCYVLLCSGQASLNLELERGFLDVTELVAIPSQAAFDAVGDTRDVLLVAFSIHRVEVDIINESGIVDF